MNQATSLWPERNHHDPMVSAPEEDDFSNFLVGEFGLDFSAFDDGTQDGHRLPDDAVTSMDTSMEQADVTNGMKEIQHAQMYSTGGPPPPHSAPMGGGYHMVGAPQIDPAIQQQIIRQHQLQQQRQHGQGQSYPGGPMIPPTPNSMEFHGAAARYYNIDSNGQVYDRQQRSKDEQMAFTPLVSPAVTPLESQFSLPEYAVPGSYFSPLTSPALEAQNAVQQRSVYSSAPSSDTAVTTSPVDQNVELSSAPSGAARKAKRKPPMPSKTSGRTVRQSPAMKAQTRRKQASSISLQEDLVRNSEDAQFARPGTDNGDRPAKIRAPRSGTESSTESISPEPLTDALMPPPALPRALSAGNSPYLMGQAKSNGNEPQTPATLMRLHTQYNHSTSMRPSTVGTAVLATPDEVMEDMMLPEAATGSRPPVPPIETGRADDIQSTPTISTLRTPTFGTYGTPLTTASNSVTPSPQIQAIASPTSVKRVESRATTGRSSKKRHTPSSSQVSPALRPKISPNIKPLIPDGAVGSVSAETSALYLASKSNYQNILEGTHLPGVSYPDALAENLTSKRTSHKIAEQGRRNRINMALKEIEALLPQSSMKSPESKSGGDGGKARERTNSDGSGLDAEKAAANVQGNSKASTVEMAIVYIKSLQSELAETKAKLASAEKKLATTTEED